MYNFAPHRDKNYALRSGNDFPPASRRRSSAERERRAGELIAKMEKNQGAVPGKTGRKGQPVLDPRPKLANLGVSRRTLVAKNLGLAHPLWVATHSDIRAAVDAFLATPKRIVGHDVSPLWAPGYAPGTVEMKYPLEIEGELRGSQLMVVGFPRERELKFRVGILFPAMICRLDYTDETHQNSADGMLAGAVPPEVVGPHYHSWPLNRRFFRGTIRPVELHDAVPYVEPGRTFDAILRWFCADTNIEQPPPDHLIALPRADTLL